MAVCPWNNQCWEGVQQDVPIRVKLRLLLYFPPLEMLYSALHLYSPTSLAELMVRVNSAGVKSDLFKADTCWLCLNSVYLTGGEPDSERQERVTFCFITTFKAPCTSTSLGLDSISGKKELLSELTAPMTQETPRFFPKYVDNQAMLICVETGHYTFSTSNSRQLNYFSKPECSFTHDEKRMCSGKRGTATQSLPMCSDEPPPPPLLNYSSN